MENNNKRNKQNDSLAAVKAAAWAWYQHGSGSELGKTAREYDATRRHQAPPIPSRYKLEAMRSISLLATKNNNNNNKPNNILEPNKALLDEYEIRSISRQLDSLIECSRIARESNYSSTTTSSDDDDKSVTSTSSAKMMRRNIMKRLWMRGFWVRHAAAVCGARETQVVETATVTRRRFINR